MSKKDADVRNARTAPGRVFTRDGYSARTSEGASGETDANAAGSAAWTPTKCQDGRDDPRGTNSTNAPSSSSARPPYFCGSLFGTTAIVTSAPDARCAESSPC